MECCKRTSCVPNLKQYFEKIRKISVLLTEFLTLFLFTFAEKLKIKTSKKTQSYPVAIYNKNTLKE